MDANQIKKYKEAALRQKCEIKHAYRYDDWTMIVRADGRIMKCNNGVLHRPFSVVRNGMLPDADQIPTGVIC